MKNSNKKKSSNEIELRSEKVRNLLGEIPSSLIRWGTVIIIAIFLIEHENKAVFVSLACIYGRYRADFNEGGKCHEY